MSVFKVVSSKLASEIDQELMGPKVGFTLQQLMELAGFSIAQTIQREYPLGQNNNKKEVLIIAGPGNNGGDGLVCARHLKLFGYDPIVYYPIASKRTPFYGQLVKQLEFFQVPILTEEQSARWVDYLKPDKTLCIVDAIFGFSFKPPMREPFGSIVEEMHKVEDKIPIVAVDIPTGWDVDEGPVSSPHLTPSVLVSLTVPKPCSKFIKSARTAHYVGGRFIPKQFAEKYGFEPFSYQGTDQILKL
ncbi:NAD(P)H-hydrate epimerase [Monosporozyma servazzii]